MALEHRVLIYVFRRRSQGVEYLLERRTPALEWSWTPIPAAVGVTESLASAARRSMELEWHAPPPLRLVDLHVCNHESVGDLDLIDWGVGYGVRPEWEPSSRSCPDHAELTWRRLPVALELLEGESARRALFRLHLEAAS